MIEKFKAYSSTIAAFSTAAIILFSTFKMIDKWNDTSRDVIEIIHRVDSLQKIPVQDPRIDSIEISVKNIKEIIEEEIRQDEKYHRSYVQYVRDNTKFSQDLFKYIEGLNLSEKKK